MNITRTLISAQFTIHFFFQQWHVHTHTHTHSLSLSLSHSTVSLYQFQFHLQNTDIECKRAPVASVIFAGFPTHPVTHADLSIGSSYLQTWRKWWTRTKYTFQQTNKKTFRTKRYGHTAWGSGSAWLWHWLHVGLWQTSRFLCLSLHH